MVKCDGRLDEALVEVARPTFGMQPELLEDFVAAKELMVIEERDPLDQPRVNGR